MRAETLGEDGTTPDTPAFCRRRKGARRLRGGPMGVAYQRDGVAEIAFASQKQYLSFHLLRGDVRDALAGRLAGQDMGKSCLRFRKSGSVDLDLVRDLLRATAAAPGPIA
ncbi:DUF1801 domain-containing protein [Streptomyces cellulosae]